MNPPVIWWDSYEYLSQTAAPLAGPRPWGVPFLWSLVYPEHRLGAIVTLHALCWVASWSALAWSMRTWSRPALMAVTALAMWAWQFVPHLLSESLALSSLALLAAATISRARPWAWLTVAGFWASTRPENPLALALMACGWGMARRWRTGLVALAMAVALMLPGAQTSSQAIRVLDVMVARVAPAPKHLEWFVARGMPLPDLIVERAGQSMDDPFPWRHRDLAEWNAWAQDRGFATYARFLLAHPVYALTSWVKPMLRSPLAIVALVALLSVAVRGRAGAIFAALLACQALVVWHGDAKEYLRHFLQLLFALALATAWAVGAPRRIEAPRGAL